MNYDRMLATEVPDKLVSTAGAYLYIIPLLRGANAPRHSQSLHLQHPGFPDAQRIGCHLARLSACAAGTVE